MNNGSRPAAAPAAGAASAAAEAGGPITVGVLADTHVPDRLRDIHPGILPAFEAAGVGHILHAGDVCSPAVIRALEAVAPVTAVRGNRDWLLPALPLAQEVRLGGARLGLMHGHGGFARYLWDKAGYLFNGYHLERYLDTLIHTLPEAQVVIYGHTHHPELLWHAGKLLFNPGSASFGYSRSRPPSVGLLHLAPGQPVKAEFVFLEGYRPYKRQWQPAPAYSPIRSPEPAD